MSKYKLCLELVVLYKAHCNALQHTSTHCNTLQQNTPHCNTYPDEWHSVFSSNMSNSHECGANNVLFYCMWVGELEMSAGCRCVMQCDVFWRRDGMRLLEQHVQTRLLMAWSSSLLGSVLQCVVVCCSFLQCVAVCCSVLQCVAVCCSVLQCVAVCCSVCGAALLGFRNKIPKI